MLIETLYAITQGIVSHEAFTFGAAEKTHRAVSALGQKSELLQIDSFNCRLDLPMKMVSCFTRKPQCNVRLSYSVTRRLHVQIYLRRPTILTEEWIVGLFVNRYGHLPGKYSYQKHLCLPSLIRDLLCGIVVRGPGYRPRGPGSISGTTRFSEK
jgi:hypothetical protein